MLLGKHNILLNTPLETFVHIQIICATVQGQVIPVTVGSTQQHY